MKGPRVPKSVSLSSNGERAGLIVNYELRVFKQLRAEEAIAGFADDYVRPVSSSEQFNLDLGNVRNYPY